MEVLPVPLVDIGLGDLRRAERAVAVGVKGADPLRADRQVAPGEFGGGVVDMQTISVPDEPFFSFSAGLGGDTRTTFRDAITYDGGDWDLLGFDDDTRKMPRELREAIATGKRIDASSFSAEELQRILGRPLEKM